MTEQTPQPGPPEPDEPMDSQDPFSDAALIGDEDPPLTGVPQVDAVLDDIGDLDELPLDQHLGAFERAHDALRSALDATPHPAPGDPRSRRDDPAADEPA
jgi:hypothetical protein